MARYVGPCVRCGVPVDRTIKPGRDSLCVPCAIDKQGEYCRTLAEGSHPDLVKCTEAGLRTKAAIEAKSGHIYEKWRQGLIRAASGEWD